MNVFVANLGNRDIWFNVGTPENPDFVTFKKWERADEISQMLGCDPGTRACIPALEEAYPDQELLGLLRFPILEPALLRALNHCTERGEMLDRIIFGATDQDPQEEPDHYPWDTIEAARLLEKLLPQKAEFESHLNSGSIETLRITSNPQRFDDAYQQLGGLFDSFKGTEVHVYASVKGGIPALNDALRVRSLNALGPRAHLIETDEPSEKEKRRGVNGDSFIVDSWPYRRDTLLRIARDLLDTYEYDALLDVLRRELSSGEKDRFRDVEALLRHAAARFSLDLEGAQAALEDEMFDTGMHLSWRRSANHDAMSLQRIHEIVWTAQILLQRQDYGNFVVRVATLAELCRRQIVRLLLGFAPGRQLGLKGLPSELDALKDALRQKFERDELYAVDEAGNILKVNKPLRKAVVEWAANSSGAAHSADRINSARELVSKLEPLEELRNALAHEARGPSKQEIKQAFPNCREDFPVFTDELLESMKWVHVSHEGDDAEVTSNVYQDLNEEVIAKLSGP